MIYKLAVILPSPYTGGVVRSLINICRMLVMGAAECGDDLKLTVGLPKDQALSLCNVEILKSLGIRPRFFVQRKMKIENLVGAYGCFGINTTSALSDEVTVFDDGISNFEDSDFWYLISDAVHAPLPAHRKYACMIYDYANRYVPEIFDEAQWRGFYSRTETSAAASFVVTTTTQARRDAINFAGVSPDRVKIFPIEFDPINQDISDFRLTAISRFAAENYVLWPTILSGHENHLHVLRDLESFLADSDSYVIIIGKGTSSFDPENETPDFQHPYIQAVSKFIASSRILRERIEFLDFVSDQTLLALMKRAMCLLHTSRGDNGSYTVVEAAWQGTPSLSNRYAAMEDVGQYFGLPLEFFDFYRPGSLADGLHRVQLNQSELRSRLPSRDALMNFSYEKIAMRYWQLFSTNMQSALEPM